MSGDSRAPEAIELVPVGRLGEAGELLPWLAAALEERLGVPVRPGKPLAVRRGWRDAKRRQTNSNAVVDALIERDAPGDGPPPARWVLAVTDEDLFAPGRSFVFGEAAQDGAWAVISLARLRDAEGDGTAAPIVRRRVLTEAVHELGHVAGLGHCDRPACVMFPSATLADTDRKGAVPCAGCAAALERALGVDRPLGSR